MPTGAGLVIFIFRVSLFGVLRCVCRQPYRKANEEAFSGPGLGASSRNFDLKILDCCVQLCRLIRQSRGLESDHTIVLKPVCLCLFHLSFMIWYSV